MSPMQLHYNDEEEDDLIDSDDTFTIKLRHVSSPES